MGRDEEAMRVLQATLDVHPHDYYVLRILVYCCSTSGRGELAVSTGQQILAETKSKTSAKGLLGFAYAIAGAREEALKILEEIKEEAKMLPNLAYWTALTYTRLGMNEEALRWMERAHEAGMGLLLIVGVEPAFASLHSEPRCQALLRKMGIPT